MNLEIELKYSFTKGAGIRWRPCSETHRDTKEAYKDVFDISKVRKTASFHSNVLLARLNLTCTAQYNEYQKPSFSFNKRHVTERNGTHTYILPQIPNSLAQAC